MWRRRHAAEAPGRAAPHEINHLTPWEESRGPGRDKGFQDPLRLPAAQPFFLSGRSSPPQLPLLVHLVYYISLVLFSLR
ncbi:unnamed protein product [Arctogadus glacialis]